MSARLPRPLARKLDRLSRRAHRVYRFAHHPLCTEYQHELIRLGRRARVCRGCTLAISGSVTGAASAFTIPLARLPSVLAIGAGCAIMLGAMLVARDLRPRATRSPERLAKLGSRLLPFALMSAAFTLGIRLGTAGGWLVSIATAGALFGLDRRYRQRGPERSACLRCPEFSSPTPCRGFAPIVQRERAFARMAGRLIQRS